MIRPWNKQSKIRPWQKEKKRFGNDRFDGDFYQTMQWKNFRAWYKAKHPAICKACGKPAKYLDHIIPRSQGGAALTENNVQWLCPRCHAGKTNRERKNKN